MRGSLPPTLVLDHVGIALEADAALPLLELLGSRGQLVEMPSGVAIERVGADRRVELVRPLRPGSPIESFLAQRGPGLHHLAFRVAEPLPDVQALLLALGFEMAGGITRSSTGLPSLFLHPRSTGGVLVEIVEGLSR